MARDYTIQPYNPETTNGVSIPELHKVTQGKLDELARRYKEKYPDDRLLVTSMTRNPRGGTESSHNLGWGFDLYSDGLWDPERRTWLAEEAGKIGPRSFFWTMDARCKCQKTGRSFNAGREMASRAT